MRSSCRRAAQGPPVALLRVWQPSIHCCAAVQTQYLVVWRLVINQQRWLRLELDVGDMPGLCGDLLRTRHQCRAHPSCAHPLLTPQREGLRARAVQRAPQPHSWSRLATAVARPAHGAGPHRRPCSRACSQPHRTLARPASARTRRSTQRTLGGFLPSLPSILSLSFCAKSVLIISICAHAPALRRQQAPAVRGSRSQLPGPSCPFGFVILVQILIS